MRGWVTANSAVPMRKRSPDGDLGLQEPFGGEVLAERGEVELGVGQLPPPGGVVLAGIDVLPRTADAHRENLHLESAASFAGRGTFAVLDYCARVPSIRRLTTESG